MENLWKKSLKKKIKYDNFYKVLISVDVAEELNLDLNFPYVEVNEIKKNKSFIAKKAITENLEKKIANKAPITKINIDNLNKSKKIKKTKVDKINLIDKKIRDTKWNIYKKEIDEIVDELEKEFINDLKKERERFLSKGGNEIDFNHVSKEKEEFNKIKFEYRKIKRSYFKEIENKKKINSALKRNIINQIKELIGSEKSINTIYKEFKSLQKNWHNIGYSLRIDSNDLWENYKHHVERFYDFLHINRELRNIDFEQLIYKEECPVRYDVFYTDDLMDLDKYNRKTKTNMYWLVDAEHQINEGFNY